MSLGDGIGDQEESRALHRDLHVSKAEMDAGNRRRSEPLNDTYIFRVRVRADLCRGS